MRPWLAVLLLALVAMQVVCAATLKYDRDNDGKEDDSDNDGIPDAEDSDFDPNGASFATPSLPLLLLSAVPLLALRLFGSS